MTMECGGFRAIQQPRCRNIGWMLALSIMYSLVAGEALFGQVWLHSGHYVATHAPSHTLHERLARPLHQNPLALAQQRDGLSHTQAHNGHHAWAEASQGQAFSAQDLILLGMSAAKLVNPNLQGIPPANVPYLPMADLVPLFPPPPIPCPIPGDDRMLVQYIPEPPERPPVQGYISTLIG